MSIAGQFECDVAIVGASISGCAAAALFARRGLRVVLIEQRRDSAAYKRMCTHYILPCARPTLQRLGLDARIEHKGGVRNSLAIWTRWGLIPAVDVAKKNFGYNVRRVTLDPLLRSLATETPGVEYWPGFRASRLCWREGRVVGLEATTTEGERRLVSARLTVAADGRTSSLVDMAGIATRETANNRFSCFAFFKNIPDEDRSRSRMWLLEPEVGYQFPNDGDTTLIAIMPLKSRLAAYKADPESCFTRFVEALREAPRIAGAERVSKVMMYARNSNLIRGAAPDGMTLLGDAAMTSDPLAGVGISWAFLSAEWLVDLVSEPLLLGRPLRAALRAYRRRHWWELRAHHKTIADLSQGGELNAIQKLLFSAGTRDARTAELINDFLARDIGVAQFLSPAALMRAAGVNFRHALRAREGHARGADESLTEA